MILSDGSAGAFSLGRELSIDCFRCCYFCLLFNLRVIIFVYCCTVSMAFFFSVSTSKSCRDVSMNGQNVSDSGLFSRCIVGGFFFYVHRVSGSIRTLQRLSGVTWRGKVSLIGCGEYSCIYKFIKRLTVPDDMRWPGRYRKYTGKPPVVLDNRPFNGT